MNLKLLTVSLLALAVATTVTLTGCKKQEETTIETPPGEEVVVPPAAEPGADMNVQMEDHGAAAPAGEATAPATNTEAPAGEAAAPATNTEAPAGEAAH